MISVACSSLHVRADLGSSRADLLHYTPPGGEHENNTTESKPLVLFKLYEWPAVSVRSKYFCCNVTVNNAIKNNN